MAQQPKAWVFDAIHHLNHIRPIAFERRAAFRRAREKFHGLLLLQPPHAHAVNVQPVLIPPERAVEPDAIAVVEVMKGFVGVAVFPNLEFLRRCAVVDLNVEIGFARLRHVLTSMHHLARHLRLDRASIGQRQLRNFL